jgi:hypothetical protein
MFALHYLVRCSDLVPYQCTQELKLQEKNSISSLISVPLIYYLLGTWPERPSVETGHTSSIYCALRNIPHVTCTDHGGIRKLATATAGVMSWRRRFIQIGSGITIFRACAKVPSFFRRRLRFSNQLSSPTISFLLFATGSYTMSTVHSMSTSRSNYTSIFNSFAAVAALETYSRKTKQDLTSHPLFPRIRSCDSPDAIITVLRGQTTEFNQAQSSDDGRIKWLTPTVNVLYSFSAALDSDGVVGFVNIMLFSYHIVRSNIYLSGTRNSEPNFYGDWRSSPGLYFSWFPCATNFNTLTLRHPKMSALVETNLSTSLTPSKDPFNGLRSTLALHRLRP